MNDTVLFISAYNSTSYKFTNWILQKIRRLSPFSKKEKIQSLLEKHHLSFVATDENIISVEGKANVETCYDYIHQETTFSFKSKNISNNNSDTIPPMKDTRFYMSLRHAQSVLVDERYFTINFTFCLEPFLVWIDGRMYQVDASTFMMNDVLFVIFKIIDYKTGKPLTKDDVGAKAKNYNLLIADKYQFFDENQPTPIAMKISEIVYENIYDFLYELSNKSLAAKEYSFVHDTLVFSNNIKNVSEYFCKLIGIKKPISKIKDISTLDAYRYYPQDGCSVITHIDYDNFDAILYAAIVLEAIKLYIHIFQITNLEDETDIHRTIRNDIYLQNLFCSPNFPIMTYNLLNYIRESESYKKHSEALQLKIAYLSAQNELKKNRNATILNVLLYVISLLGAIGTLDVIEQQFAIPFEYSFIVITILFLLGLIWWIIEYRNNKSL